MMEKEYEIDLHRIEPSYEHTRIYKEKALMELYRSIEQYGQLEPVIMVPHVSDRFVLIDGYLRLTVMRKLRQDTIRARIWDTDEKKALIRLMVFKQKKECDPLEEGYLLLELKERFDMSLTDIAMQIGRDKSFVKRRLDLVCCLSEEVCQAVRSGHVSTWAATRVMVPLARANTTHATQVILHLQDMPMTSRDLMMFFKHYQNVNKSVRENMVKNPSLFVKALKFKAEEKQAHLLQIGPEGRLLNDMAEAYLILKRCAQSVKEVMYPSQTDRQTVVDMFKKLSFAMDVIGKEISGNGERRDENSSS
jgi:ParB/RepB/Spo0J family partition protein